MLTLLFPEDLAPELRWKAPPRVTGAVRVQAQPAAPQAVGALPLPDPAGKCVSCGVREEAAPETASCRYARALCRECHLFGELCGCGAVRRAA